VSRGTKGCKPNALYRGLFHEIAIRDRKSKPDDGEFASRETREPYETSALRFIATFGKEILRVGFYAASGHPALRIPGCIIGKLRWLGVLSAERRRCMAHKRTARKIMSFRRAVKAGEAGYGTVNVPRRLPVTVVLRPVA